MFAQEVERAVERTRGDGLHAKRVDELVGARRSARRASFGNEHAPALEHDSPDDAPAPASSTLSIQAAPAPAVRAHEDLALPEPSEPEPPAAAPCAPAKDTAAARPEPVAAPTAPVASAPQPNPSVVRSTVAESRAAPVRSGEPAPIEPPPVVRLGTERSAKATSAARAAGAPDTAVFARAEEILRQIRLHATPGVQRLTLDLEPADLGRLSIQLALRAGRVTAIVRAESARTLELLQQREQDLRAVLDQRGVRADSLRFELGFGAGHARREAPADAPRAAADRVAPPPAPPRGPAAGIDTYA